MSFTTVVYGIWCVYLWHNFGVVLQLCAQLAQEDCQDMTFCIVAKITSVVSDLLRKS